MTVDGGAVAVLEDPTGRRARWLRRAGRLVFVLFLCWLLAIVLGGLGLFPVAGIPLTRVLRPSTGPPPLAELPRPRQPSASDLRPALTAPAFVAGTGKASRQAAPTGAPGRSSSAPGRGGSSPGRSATAPGKTKKTPTLPAARGRSTTAPGKTKKTPTPSTARGRSTTAPGKTKKTPTPSTARGRSTTARGKTRTTTTSSRRPRKP